jgi:Ser/Thr protein kinase RdoA (MazF antagonist)
MLPIKLMSDFLETVDQTKMQSPVVDQIAAKWLTAPVTIYSLRASANITSIVQTQEKRQVVLRFNPVNDRPIEHLRSELELIRRLAHNGIRTASPLPSLMGNEIECVSTQLEDFHALAFTVLPGEHFEFDKLTLNTFREWGRALAELHAASENLVIENRPSWATHICMVKEIVPKDDRWLWSDLVMLEDKLNQFAVDKARFGLIHYDFELDNILWDQGKPGIIDFDESGYYWFVADIAIALRKLFDNRIEQINFNDERFQAFMEGYRSLRQIKTEELKNIPLFLRLHNLVTYARVYRSIIGEIQQEAQWLKDLRQELQNRLEQYRVGVEMYPIGTFYEAWSERIVSET